jgi:hypothetical protein
MTIQRLSTRVARLKQHAQTQEEGVLHVWRMPEESAAEAFDRCEVDPEDFPAVQVHVWPGERASARLAPPPAPLWGARTPPAIADLERRLHPSLTVDGTWEYM